MENNIITESVLSSDQLKKLVSLSPKEKSYFHINSFDIDCLNEAGGDLGLLLHTYNQKSTTKNRAQNKNPTQSKLTSQEINVKFSPEDIKFFNQISTKINGLLHPHEHVQIQKPFNLSFRQSAFMALPVIVGINVLHRLLSNPSTSSHLYFNDALYRFNVFCLFVLMLSL